MRLFHSTPTDLYLPLSHDNAYLFVHYDKIINFLSFSVDKKYRHILAKPVKNNYQIDWYSPYEGLVWNSSADQSNSNQIYWEFYVALEAKINELAVRQDDNTKDWIALLKKVFNPADNVLYSNGKDISIIWGWKFENNTIVKPDISSTLKGGASQDDHFIDKTIPTTPSPKEGKSNQKIDKEEEVIEGLPPDYEEDIEEPKEDEQNYGSFIEFLKNFASRYWWFLLLLLLLICLTFFIKSLSI